MSEEQSTTADSEAAVEIPPPSPETADAAAAGEPGGPPASSRPARRRRWPRLLIFCILVYAAWCIVLYFLQDRLLFPTDLAPAPAALLYDASTEELRLKIEGGGQVVAWFIPARLARPRVPSPLVLDIHERRNP